MIKRNPFIFFTALAIFANILVIIFGNGVIDWGLAIVSALCAIWHEVRKDE